MGETLWILGAFWIIYGIAGLRGHQNIKNEFKNRPWTLEYKKACGRCWLVLGIPCLVWGIICRVMEVSGWRAWLPFILALIPGMVYSFAVEKKYKKLLKEAEQESGNQPVGDATRDE